MCDLCNVSIFFYYFFFLLRRFQSTIKMCKSFLCDVCFEIHSFIYSYNQHRWRYRYWRITFYLLLSSAKRKLLPAEIESEIMPFLLDTSSYQTLASTHHKSTQYGEYFVHLLFSILFLVSFDFRGIAIAVYFAVRSFVFFFFFFFAFDSCKMRNMKKRCKRHTRKPDISTLTKFTSCSYEVNVLFWWLSLVYYDFSFLPSRSFMLVSIFFLLRSFKHSNGKRRYQE